MTSGERMVWAAEFTRAMAGLSDPGEQGIAEHAVIRAQQAVAAMRTVAKSHRIGDEARLLLADMLGTGADR